MKFLERIGGLFFKDKSDRGILITSFQFLLFETFALGFLTCFLIFVEVRKGIIRNLVKLAVLEIFLLITWIKTLSLFMKVLKSNFR